MKEAALIDPVDLSLLESAAAAGLKGVTVYPDTPQYRAAERLSAKGWIRIDNSLCVIVTPLGMSALQEHHNSMKELSKTESQCKKADRKGHVNAVLCAVIGAIGAIFAALISVFVH